MLDRRGLLVGGAALAATPAITSGAAAQAMSAPGPGAEEKVRAAARGARKRLGYADGRFSGEAYDWLVVRGREAQFFLHGEEHGIAENPKLAAQLFRDLVPAGYRHAAVEISAPMAREIDVTLARGGLPALREFLADLRPNVAFFGMREEAEWLAAARAAVGGKGPVLWGNDYEVGADRHLIALLKPMRKPAAAQAALERLDAASAGTWAKYDQTGGPQYIFSFAGDPALVRAVRDAWPGAKGEADWILDTLERTLEINRAWTSGRHAESNQLRAANLRANFRRNWRMVEAKAPRVYFKYGATHLVRGLTNVGTFDLGTLLPELAETQGRRSFSMMVLPGNDAHAAVFDPTRFTYAPGAPKDSYQKGLGWVIDEAWPDAFTLFDTARIRPILQSAPSADPELVRVVNGFDAILVMSGSTPSSNLA